MTQSFAATVEQWARDVEGVVEVIFRESVQELVSQADDLLTQLVYAAPPSPNYRRTGFLRSSLTISTASMPLASRPQGALDADYMAEITATIAGSDITETIYVGWTAEYAPFVHWGARGQPPKPWVTLVAQRWQEIVARVAARVKDRLGL
ncbi:HK97 gp10 family phage protein [Mesorhizobium sp. Z1-4]|uniref:HK97 gp10 family phage protein n=1 Tax=Mesorhizobium sp. Z1-4 TaxID=2448478 RepID=UPI000FD8CCBE|nr:HK97 gp10 family phage protein [Mesorhizobium sp. Z1-4]